MPHEIVRMEPHLFEEARALMSRLPVDSMDLLIVDEMGKNFSGTGMDVNVIGRWRIAGIPEPERPHAARIVALRLATEPRADGKARDGRT